MDLQDEQLRNQHPGHRNLSTTSGSVISMTENRKRKRPGHAGRTGWLTCSVHPAERPYLLQVRVGGGHPPSRRQGTSKPKATIPAPGEKLASCSARPNPAPAQGVSHQPTHCSRPILTLSATQPPSRGHQGVGPCLTLRPDDRDPARCACSGGAPRGPTA